MAAKEPDNCSVCRETLETSNQPKVLPCDHAFCKPCLQELLDKEDYDTFSCPNCREQHYIPPEGADGFKDLIPPLPPPIKTLSWSQQEGSRLSEGTFAIRIVTCKCCNESNEGTFALAAAKCAECEGEICASCVELHRKIKGLKTHQLLFPGDTQTIQLKASSCSQHKKKLEFYCEACRHPLCSNCLESSHKKHDWKLLEKARQEITERLNQRQREAAANLRECRRDVEDLEKVEGSIGTYSEELVRSVDEIFEKYSRQLTVWHDQKQQEARDLSQAAKKQVSMKKTEEEDKQERLKAGLEAAGKALQCCNDVDALAVGADALKLLQPPLETVAILKPPFVFHGEALQFGGFKEIVDGDISVTIPDDFVSLVGQEVPIIVKYNVPIYTRPLIRVIYGSTKQSSVTILPTQTERVNVWTALYKPCCGGDHSIEVCVNGVKCALKDNLFNTDGNPAVEDNVRAGPDWAEAEVDDVQQKQERENKIGLVMEVELKNPLNALNEHHWVITVQWEGESVLCEYKWGAGEYEVELVMEQT